MKRPLRIEILLVALVCFGPIIAAYVLYFGGEPAVLPQLVNEQRQLLEPPLELPAVAVEAAGSRIDDPFAGPKWSLIYVRTSPCGEPCLGDLIRLRQVHVALGADQDRVQRIYLGVGEGTRVAEDPTIAVGRVDRDGGAALLDLLEAAGQTPGEQGRIYVADPHGNLVLSYPPDAEQEGLHNDLKRLLNVSRIG